MTKQLASNTFCAVPWVGMATKPNGTARVCCLMYSHENQGIVSDDDNNPYNFRDADFDQIRNGDTFREIRLALLNGVKHPLCNTCWIKEDAGSNSRRLQTNRIYKDEFTLDAAKQHTDINGRTDWQPSYWDLRFGNLCNLKCVMCHPSSSSQWYDDYVMLYNAEQYTDGGAVIKLTKKANGKYDVGDAYDWWKSEQFWKTLETKIPYMKQIYLVGGEPMLIEPHYEFLQKIIDAGRAADIVLEYDTNMTALHARSFDLWKHFKSIILRTSLEDYSVQNDYIRYPSKWHAIEKNLDTIRSWNVSNIQCSSSTTWQILNSFTITNLLDYFDKTDTEYHVRILNSPHWYDVKILPTQLKALLIEKYTAWAGSNDKRQKKIAVLISYLNSHMETYDESALKRFIALTDRLDKSRNTNWKTVFPELYAGLKYLYD